MIILANELGVFIFILFLLDRVKIYKAIKVSNIYRNVHILSYRKTSLFQTLHFDSLNYKCDSLLHYLLRTFYQRQNY